MWGVRCADDPFLLTGSMEKIKLTSIARDTYVSVDGYGQTKINHAYAYGGPELAIKTINENFSLDVKDFVTVNFSQLAEIIDYVGELPSMLPRKNGW